jgi:hypothetical protein
MLSIYATVAESELTSMGDNVKWAARRRASQGIVEQTNNLYGYDFKRGVFAVIESEATIVREVFTRYANGDGQKLIARDLNDRGLFKRSGGLWKASDLARMLAIEKYVGDALLQKTYNAGLKTYLNDGAVKQYYIENNHEPIVDRDTFDRARARQAEQYEATRPKNGVETHPLSGKIFCGLCGKPYIRRKNNRNTPYEKWIWSDYTYVQFGRKYCGGHNIREVDLQAIFLSAYNEAAAFERTDTQTYNLSESINALLAQERELIALKVKGYITRGAYEIQHGELVKQIKETEAALLLESRRTGDGDGDAESLARIDREIESAQAAMLELNKQRARRAIDAEAYGEQSRATMAELDGLFIKRDELARQAGDRSLGDARRKMLTEFLSAQEPQTEFDRDVFGKLVETVIVNSREDIIFEFKDGTRIKAQTDGGR